MRIALYARVSTKEDATNRQEYENQLIQLREFVERKKSDGWEVFAIYADRASGGKADRVEFKKMFDAASRKEFDVVLFWSLDRFSREGIWETLGYLRKLNEYGVDWYSYREEFLRSLGPMKNMVLSIFAALAELERARQSERVKAGIARVQRQGKHFGRKKIVLDRIKIHELKKQGKSIKEIATTCKTGIHNIYRSLKETDGNNQKET
jgi:DNA invertase Pin-like site-specific DNA recombinase